MPQHDIDIDLDAQVAALRPSDFVDDMSVSVRPRPEEPPMQTPLVALQDEVSVAIESVREELRSFIESLDPILTPKIEGEGTPAGPAASARSKMSAALASWRDELLLISRDVREAAGRVEL